MVGLASDVNDPATVASRFSRELNEIKFRFKFAA
jgi:hypothetical protein